jgi:hypothetical protein
LTDAIPLSPALAFSNLSDAVPCAGIELRVAGHPLTTIPDANDWGGWVEVWCREDTGNASCVPDFLREGIAEHLTPEGWLKHPSGPLSTPYKLARWFSPYRPPWSGTGASPDMAREIWLDTLHRWLREDDPKPEPKKPYVKPIPGEHLYFIRSEGGPIKIGVSYDPARRVRDLQTSNPHPLTLLCVLQGEGHRECDYHRRFAAHRLQGEWFSPHPDILAEIARLNSEAL